MLTKLIERLSTETESQIVDTPRAKKQLFFLPPSQNLLRAGHVPVGCISFQARAMAAAASRAPSQLARRDALSLTVSAPRLSDILSNSRSGDAADWQVACGSMLWQRRFVSSLATAACSHGLPTVTPVRFVGREHRQCDRDAWQSGIARENAVPTTIVMAVARCTITAGATASEWQRKTLKMLVCGRMDRCIQQYLKQYVSAGPCNTSYGP